MYRPIAQTPSHKRVFGACLLSFMTLIAPIASVGAATRRATAPVPANSKAAKPDATTSESSLFVPAAIPAAAPVPLVGTPNITATKADAFADSDGDSKAALGETINYTVNISNATGTADATGVMFSDTLDANTTLVPGSTNVSPLAFDDAYNAIGNTLLEVGPVASPSSSPKSTVVGSVFLNDKEFLGDTFTLKAVQAVSFVGGNTTASTNMGGTVVMEPDGKFSYLPAAGFPGTTDTFTYTITDDGTDGISGNSDDLTNIGTVTITVSSSRVWYVDNSLGVNGDGRSTSPFNSLTPVNGAGGVGDVDVAGDIIYLFTGSGNYTTGLVMENTEQLIGNGVALVVDTITLRNSGTSPTISNAGGNGVTLASGNTLKGFIVGDTLTDISGTAVGNLTIATVNLTGTGRLVNLTGSGGGTTVNATFDTANSTSTTGATPGVSLTNIDGGVTFGSTPGSASIAGAGGIGFQVTGGNANLDFNGAITHTANARAIDVQTHTGGTVSFDGAVSSTSLSDGIFLNLNTGATINFTGTLTINTSASNTPGFTATGGGIVTATGTGSTISSGSGIALNVNTTIGASGLTFQSISANGAANGIVLNATGTNGLTVTGTDGADADTDPDAGTGGTIQNTTGDAISLTSANNVSLGGLNITNTGGHGINVTNLTTALTLATCALSNTGDGQNEHAMKLLNVSGTVSIQGTSFNNTAQEFINIDTTTVSPNNADMTLNVGTVTACTFTQPNAIAAIRAAGAFAGNGILVAQRFSKNYTFNISNSTFTDIKLFGFQFGSSGPGATQSTATNCNVNLNNNQFQVTITNALGNTNNRANTINIQGQNTIDIDASITNNTLNKGGGGGIQLGADTSSNINANITGNTVTNQFADGILMAVDEAASLTVLIDSNTITNTSSDGMEIANAISPDALVATLNATITNNTVTGHNQNGGANAFFAGIGVFSGTPGDITRVDIRNNAVSGNSNPASYFDYALDGSSFGGGILVKGNGSAAVTEAAFLAPGNGTNNLNNTAAAPAGAKTFIGLSTFNNNASVPLPVLTPLEAAPGGVEAVKAGSISALTQTELDTVVSAAMGRWTATGLTRKQIAIMRELRFELGDLTGSYLGEASRNRIVVDRDAGGKGWFVDATPADDLEFSDRASGTRSYTNPFTSAAGRIDLLTAIEHEIGHKLGLDDLYAEKDRDNLMYGYLTVGERRLPAQGQAKNALTSNVGNTGPHFLSLEQRRSASQTFSNHAVGRRKTTTKAVRNAAPLMPVVADVSVTIGTLPMGKSVTITFQVTVNGLAPGTPLASGVTSVSNQGSVSGSNFTTVLTDDSPGTAAPNEPTVTNISRLDLSLTKSDGVTATTPGSDLAYTLSYANLDHAANGVVITETVPTGTTFKATGSSPGWSCPDGSVGGTSCTLTLGALPRFGQAGASGTKTFIVTVVNPAAAGLGSIQNTATIADDGLYEPDINTANNTATDTDTTVNAAPDLVVDSKSDGVMNTTPGSTLTYTINYSNSGNQNAANVVLNETVPTGTVYVAAGSSAWSCANGSPGGTTCTLNVGTLNGGGGSGSATFIVTVNNPAAAGLNNISNTASIDDDHANGADLTPVNNSKTDSDVLDAAPDLTLSKVADVGSAGPNETIIYTLTYANAGNQNAVGVVITETVPLNTKFNAGASTPTVWSCPDNSVNPTTCTTTIGALAGGAPSQTVKFAVTVIDPITPGETQVSNTGTIADNGANGTDPNPGDNSTGAVDVPLRVCTAPPSGMINWWPGDGNARDIAGGKDGTLNGATATGTGKVLNGFSFDGDNDYVDVGDVDLPSTFTIDAWVNPTDLAAERTIVNKDNGTSARSYLFSITTTGALRALVNSGGALTQYQTGDSVVTAAILQHVAVTYDGAAPATEKFKFYVNGTLVAATVQSAQDAGGAPENIALATRIGLAADNASDFFGVIDELEFFNTALSEANIDLIVDAGVGGKCKPSDLTINKSHSGNFNMGSTGNEYSILVHNDGPGTTIGTTTVTDVFPAGLTPTGYTGTGWTCTIAQTTVCTSTDAIASGANFPLLKIIVTVAANPSTPVNNTATVSNDGGELDTSDNSDTDPTTLVGISDVSLTKTDSPDPVTAGNNLTYTITVSNAGPTNSNTSWTDTLPAGTAFVSLSAPGGWTCTTPAVGGTGIVSCSTTSQGVGAPADAVFTLTVNVNPSVVATSVITNTATATTTSTDLTPGNDSGTATTTVAASANLSVTKVDSPDPVAAGSNLTYTITVNNAGPSNAASVSLSDTLPTGTTFVSLSSPGGWSCTTPAVGGTGTVSCSISSQGLGDAVFTLTVNVNASVSDGTVISNTATVTSTTSDPATGNESGSATTTVQSSDFAIAKAHTGSFFIQGQTGATYTITVSNVGVAPSSGTVTVTDTLPAGLTPTGPIGLHNGWTCGISLQVLTCTRSDALTNGTSYPAITLTVDVADNAPASVDNTATVSSAGDSNTSNNSATDTVTIVSPQAAAWTLISSTLQMDEDSFSLASLNESEFAFAGTNVGTVTARANITLTEGISPFCDAGSSGVRVLYHDSDGTGSNAQVFFEIRRSSILTGGNTVVYTFDSNAHAATTDPASFVEVKPGLNFDFVNNIYWIEVKLARGIPGASAKLKVVQIYEASGPACP